MAKNRYLNTRFWSDSFIITLSPLERYLFIYFLTNEHTNISGIYELATTIIQNETGLTIKQINETLNKFEGRIVHLENWVCIKNFIKYQNNDSPKVQRGIEVEMSNVPQQILDTLYIQYGYPIDINLLSPQSEPEANQEEMIPYTYPMDTVSHSNSNSNTNSNLTKLNTNLETGDDNFIIEEPETKKLKISPEMKKAISGLPYDQQQRYQERYGAELE